MRLAEFISANTEPILEQWEASARATWPARDDAPVSPAELRDHAKAILAATVTDMQATQSEQQRAGKSRSDEGAAGSIRVLTEPSSAHGADRLASGFTISALIAEYRGLRASVLRLWRDSEPVPDIRDLEDMTRFNEAIDESLAVAVGRFAFLVDREREAALQAEQSSRERAEEANRAKDVFLAMLGHEIRTPLNAIIGWADILRHEGVEAAQLQRGLATIERNSKIQVQLVDDLLDSSRILSGKLRVTLAPCDLTEAITAGVESIRGAAEAAGLTLHVQLNVADGHIDCDAERIQQVVWNLLSNAVKFTPRGGRVDLAVIGDAGHVRILVRDTGVGIEPEMLPRVFERFQQADVTGRGGPGGLGLGLFIAKYLVEAHGGTIHVQSAGQGLGATFVVTLPLRPAVASGPGE